MISALIACQLYVVIFIALHDWVPLGALNNLAGIRAADSPVRLAVTTILSTFPFAVGLIGSIRHRSDGFPHWLMWWLWISYGAGLYGMLRTWWVPYLLISDPVRVARYQKRFANTHAFLPMRNGIRPDTLHVTFHAVVIAIIILLSVLTSQRPAQASDRTTGLTDPPSLVARSLPKSDLSDFGGARDTRPPAPDQGLRIQRLHHMGL